MWPPSARFRYTSSTDEHDVHSVTFFPPSIAYHALSTVSPKLTLTNGVASAIVPDGEYIVTSGGDVSMVRV